ncbi:acyltransferase family protein [Roseateles paludis]|jgi:predicted acyltransferase|uniref:Heparan-alpha-glucosaminide N-acetyltransferase domain-containing protein n=1 Tax=Roseateles paludis TaxID=3145238 RepID=A0ABV0FXN2_9BURK
MRLLSLDIFRGLTIAAMLLVNNPGDWGHVYAPLLHAHWHGWTPTDCIFPFFVFISGVSMHLSLARRAQAGADKGQLLATTARRALLIIAIGVLLNGFPFYDLATLRLPGVLQRLGLCTLCAAPLVLGCGARGLWLWALGLLAAYAAVQLALPVPDASGLVHTGALQPGQDVGAWLDRALFGTAHLWAQAGTWDPEGLLSTVPAVASQLLGVLAGRELTSTASPRQRALRWAAAGVLALVLSQLLDATLMPINKSLWTPPFVLLSTGWALLVLAGLHAWVDAPAHPARPAPRALLPFVVFGMNALFLYIVAGVLARLLELLPVGGGQHLGQALYAPIVALGLAPELASLLHALAFVAVLFGVALFLYRRRWFVKV